jgi:hypothetical protein
MRKLGVITLVAALSFAGVSASSASPAEPRWVTKSGEAFDISTVHFDQSAIPSLKAAIEFVPGYGNMSDDDLAVIGRDLCEHYAGGFTTDDLREAGGESLAKVGEAAGSTVC